MNQQDALNILNKRVLLQQPASYLVVKVTNVTFLPEKKGYLVNLNAWNKNQFEKALLFFKEGMKFSENSEFFPAIDSYQKAVNQQQVLFLPDTTKFIPSLNEMVKAYVELDSEELKVTSVIPLKIEQGNSLNFAELLKQDILPDNIFLGTNINMIEN